MNNLTSLASVAIWRLPVMCTGFNFIQLNIYYLPKKHDTGLKVYTSGKKRKPKVENNTYKAPRTVRAGDIEVSKLKQFKNTIYNNYYV